MPLYWQSAPADAAHAPVAPACRIVSLVPSQTELLFDLGLSKQVVGVTKFCVHPPETRQHAIVVGGTKQVDFDKIDRLRPDLIIGNKEENTRADLEQLAGRYPVWVSDVADLPGALDMIRQVGGLTGTAGPAAALAAAIEASFAALAAAVAARPTPPIPVAYLIWRKPWMVAGSGTFIDELLRRAGFANVFSHLPRYPEVSAEALAAAAPARVLLSSEPFPVRDNHLAEVQALCPQARIQLVDGELFSWYGSRLLGSAEYFRKLVNE